MPRPRTSRLHSLPPRHSTLDMRIGFSAPKAADPIYQSAEHKTWRDTIMTRAGYRCEVVENGQRCNKAAPLHRMFADHIIELKDGGRAFDPANGQCLCGAHHTKKTVAVRGQRLRPGV